MDRIYDETGLYDTTGLYDPVWNVPEPDIAPPSDWDPVEELAQILSTTSSVSPAPTPPDIHSDTHSDTPSRHRSSRRRLRQESHLHDSGRRATHVTLLITMVSLCAVCMLGWSVSYSYGQLRGIASTVLPVRLAQCWPLTVYGPWFVAALSVLRATVQRRSARRSWCVVVTASAMAVALCVSNASHAVLSSVIYGIPPVTALVCFGELVGQISAKSRPRHATHTERPISKP
ncbi:hypothetical protein J2Z21_007847 [Streptomyces griseochromogenes]|uniref:DUF2637 domain-containing protein n=1 Tax=Streptomyces griseochromogenes TaxID=68214 RepID=A0A1B1BAM3_9ACTN|nr:DUF2637 domain-containing protein [Streptomyces griseochromogenes]ANP55878.1 hypothetical protein AVL59_45335 [Streptomyces griseochromogenes]MBP2054837.1 hypothetical protein [Streptomyces griseochromogenes]